jgi:uncharacterized repeat protein (TIGR03806 family)
MRLTPVLLWVSVTALCACSAELKGVQITSPEGPVFANGPVSVEVAVTGSADRVELQLDGQVVGIRDRAPYSFLLETSAQSEGEHQLVAHAVQGVKALDSPEVMLTVDRTGPTATAEGSDPGPRDALVVRFSEPVDPDSTGLVILQQYSVVVPSSSMFNPTDKLTVTPGEAMKSGPVQLVLGGVKDLAGNPVATAQVSWTIPRWLPLAKGPPAVFNQPAVVADAKGDLHYLELSDDGATVLLKRSYEQQWLSAAIALTSPNPADKQPALIFDKDGRAVVALAGSGAASIHVRRFNGVDWTSLDVTGALGIAPTLVLDPDQNPVLGWRDPGPSASMHLRRLEANDTWASPWPVLVVGGGSSNELAIAFGPDRAPVAAFAAGNPSTVEVHTVAAGASAWSQIGGTVHSGFGDRASRPTLLVPAAGEIWVSWEGRTNQLEDARVSRWTSAFSRFVAVGKVLELDVRRAGRAPRLARSAQGLIYAAWVETLLGGESRVRVHLWQNQFWGVVGEAVIASNGATPPVLTSLTLSGEQPAVGLVADGKLHAFRFNSVPGATVEGLPTRSTAASPCQFPSDPPLILSQTHCFTELSGKRVPAAGLVQFELNAPLWSDGAAKRRFMLLPPGEKAGATPGGAWTMPVGTILIKEFMIEPFGQAPQIMETRFLVKRSMSSWDGYSYRWREDRSDADLLPDAAFTQSYTLATEGGSTRSHTHTFPSRAQCQRCHTEAVGRVLGLNTAELNREVDYGGTVENQLTALERAGYVTFPSGNASGALNPRELPRMADPLDRASAALEPRVRAYLATNCAHCHHPTGERATRDMRYETALADSKLCENNEVVPGSPSTSVLYNRVNARPGMAPIATLQVDTQFVELLNEWINSKTTCP